jgi:hypothetical protein|uniref:Uncharacterized protein n=1 Tax=viral metagenome TaxID=1070528 RepID=A0A6C0IP19_9ZZZZ
MYRMLKNIQNNQMSGVAPMPLKDSTSSNENSFAMNRRNYFQTNQITANTVSENLQKKYSGNRDASSVMSRRKANAVGVGSLNSSKDAMSFTSNNNRNEQDTALKRVRNGGYVPSPKIAANPSNRPVL